MDAPNPVVIITPALQGPTKGIGKIEVDAGSIRAVIDAIEAEHAGFRRQIFSDDGKLHRFISLFHNGTMVTGAELDAPVRPGDEIEILAALAGG